jgi:hypothetical protein
VINGESNRLRLSKAQAKDGIPDNKNDRIEYREQAKPEEESLALSPAKSIKNDCCNSKCCDDLADK